jgi:hypothetical protein
MIVEPTGGGGVPKIPTPRVGLWDPRPEFFAPLLSVPVVCVQTPQRGGEDETLTLKVELQASREIPARGQRPWVRALLGIDRTMPIAFNP